MAAQSKNSRVARRDNSVPAKPRVTHLLYSGEMPGKVQRKPLGFYTSEEEAVAAQVKFPYRTIVIVI